MSGGGTSEGQDGRSGEHSEHGATRPDAAHLDRDPEALEDPVHHGDATHQHDLHAQAAGSTEHDTPDDGSDTPGAN